MGPHALRHTFATLLLSQGENLRVIQSLMNHKSLAPTVAVSSFAKPGVSKGGERLKVDGRLECSVVRFNSAKKYRTSDLS